MSKPPPISVSQLAGLLIGGCLGRPPPSTLVLVSAASGRKATSPFSLSRLERSAEVVEGDGGWRPYCPAKASRVQLLAGAGIMPGGLDR